MILLEYSEIGHDVILVILSSRMKDILGLVPASLIRVEREVEYRALTFLSFRPYLAAVPMNDALHRG